MGAVSNKYLISFLAHYVIAFSTQEHGTRASPEQMRAGADQSLNHWLNAPAEVCQSINKFCADHSYYRNIQHPGANVRLERSVGKTTNTST